MRLAFVLSLLVAAGCGDDGVQQQLDAPPSHDAPPDAPPAAGSVTLTITHGREPRPGIEVHFQNADSSLVATVVTDANGIATADMAAGGFVTAVSPFDAAGQVTTVYSYAGVRPGDALKLHAGLDPDLIDVEVRIPVDAEADAYVLHTSCNFGRYELSGGGGSASLPGGHIEIPGCPTTDMLLETFDANGVPAKFIYRADVPLTDDELVDLTDSEYRDMIDMTYTFKHVPDGLSSVFAITSLMNATGRALFGAMVVPVENGTAITVEKRPNAPGIRHVISSEIITGGLGLHYVDEWGPVTDYTLDLNGVLLREFATMPAFDATTHSLAWTTNPSGSAPDLASARLKFTRSEQEWRWLVVGPAGTTDELVFPVLPGDAQKLNPLAGDAVTYEIVQTAKVPGGYDAFRATYFSDRITGLMSSPAGRAVFQNITQSDASDQPLRSGLQRRASQRNGRPSAAMLPETR